MDNHAWTVLYLILVILSFVCFVIAAVTALTPGRHYTRLVPLGLAFWVSISVLTYMRAV